MDTVIINDQVLMEDRQVKTVREAEVIELAEKAITEAINRTDLHHLLALPERFWGVTRGLTQ